MPRLTINGKLFEVTPGTTVLEAARQNGIDIPTACFRKGLQAVSSCMLCVVKDGTRDRLIPSCAAAVVKDMVIETDTDEVHDARRSALELLLSEHVGDCEGPCQRVCPAHMDIPLMLRTIAAGRLTEAIATIKREIALPAILGRICPAPCEKACRRAAYDSAVSICLLKRCAADADLARPENYNAESAAETGRKVAIIGAGPAGLAAAWHLRCAGISCTVFEAGATAGGALRTGPGTDRLPHSVIDAEIALIQSLGARFELNTRVGHDITLDAVRESHDAVIVAVGHIESKDASPFGLPAAKHGIQAAPHTFATPVEGVFAAGSAVAPTRMAVKALADGKRAAASVRQFLAGERVIGMTVPLVSVIGRLGEGEIDEFMKDADRSARVEPASADNAFKHHEAIREARRCLHCDCRKVDSCVLLRLARLYGAERQHYRGLERALFERVTDHPLVIYEPGKCIRCGLCIRITKAATETLGLTFIGRGFAVRVDAPLGATLRDALRDTAGECVEACPTGALAFRDEGWAQ